MTFKNNSTTPQFQKLNMIVKSIKNQFQRSNVLYQHGWTHLINYQSKWYDMSVKSLAREWVL